MTSIGSRRLRSKSFERKLERTAYLFIMPAAILLIVFCIVPMLGSFWVSMQKMGVDLSQAEFVGLDNYTKALSDRRFIQSVGITLKYTAVEVPLQMIIGVLLSALLAKNTILNKLFRSIYFLPVVASAVTVGVTWQLVLHSNIGISPTGSNAWAFPMSTCSTTRVPPFTWWFLWQFGKPLASLPLFW